jgi:PelA/Pel-15E family pectate lyase
MRSLALTTLCCGVAPVVWAAPVTADRVAALPMVERAAWQEYLERSASLARLDRDALAAEVAAEGLPVARRPPSGEDFKVPRATDPTWFAGEDAATLADAVLSYQTPSGGWSKHNDYAAGMRQPGTQWTSQSEPGRPFHYLATFDNHATTREITFLARVAAATGREDCRAAVLRGVRFILQAQFPNGGWPQVYPLEGGYHDAVTFNDDVMVDVVELLRGVSSGVAPYAEIDEPLRQEAAAAWARGLGCVLATQIEMQGRKTGWCAQYDALTLEPTRARAFEPAALGGLETIHVLRCLMRLPEPDQQTVAAVVAGLEWLDASRVEGLRKTKCDDRTAYVEDATSNEVYVARFYDLRTGRPMFPGRDGVVYETFEEMARRNRVSYDYLSDFPRSTVTDGAAKWPGRR